MDKAIKEKLIKSAVKAIDYAYHPISKKGVGAALLTKKGNIYQGANVQSVISGLGSCAEICSIYNAVAHGEYCFEAIVVAFPSENGARPCGACQQMLYEFSEVGGKDIKIICVNNKGKVVEETSIKKLMPKGYGPKESGRDVSRYRK